MHLHVRKIHSRIRKTKKTNVLITFVDLRNAIAINNSLTKNFFIVVAIKTFSKSFAKFLVANYFDHVSIIIFIVDHIKDVNIYFDFREWSYTRVKTSLSSLVKSEFIYLNTRSRIILANKEFFRFQSLDTLIRIMILSIIVRNLNDIKHRIDEYIIAFMYFSKIKNEKSIFAKIAREIHLIDNLKTNMLIENDLINLEKIVIDVISKFAHIENSKVATSSSTWKSKQLARWFTNEFMSKRS